MKKLNGLQKLAANLFRIPAVTNQLQSVVNNLAQSNLRTIGFNNGVSIYPYGNDLTYIEKGYNKNAWVYSIVSKCAKKFGQVPWYHYKIKTSERKTWADYVSLTKDRLQDPKAVIEAKKMKIKSVDQVVIDSPLSKFLKKPNRNQSGAQLFEQLYGFKLLTGEGNLWFSRPDPSARPSEMFIIPKQNLALVKGGDPWAIAEYKILLSGVEFVNPKENILMWKFPNYLFDPLTLQHLRGQSPLDAGLLTMQSSNENAERLVAMNKNQGVAGMVFDKGKRDYPSPKQAQFIRSQFNEIVNDKDLAGQIAWMTGDLGYIQFGLTAEQLQLIEQKDADFKTLCNIFDLPWQLFGNSDSYENRKQYKRDFVYDNIAVAAYGLRDELNAKLITEFNLDRDRDVIDCSVLDLPELSEDLKTQIDTLSKADFLTPNEKREYVGYDRMEDQNMDKIYTTSSTTSLEQINMDAGTNLDAEMSLLNA
jgi:HK97 family phage portal protein